MQTCLHANDTHSQSDMQNHSNLLGMFVSIKNQDPQVNNSVLFCTDEDARRAQLPSKESPNDARDVLLVISY